eukprot:9835930-Lingulodinium_polyedra.AAC.1
MGKRGITAARSIRRAGAGALARACAALARRAAGQEPATSRPAATSIQSATTATPGSAHGLATGMHQVWGTHGIPPAGL